MKKECIAMLLAGGQGSRLGDLTKNIAKPAVSFAGKYRIIDFSLSNCTNSGIDTVGVLIQYRPMVLTHYIGTGAAWDLDTSAGGVHVLPPYETQEGGEWYRGTADSIYHNIDFIEEYDPEYVLILSADHLYKMDYNEMLQSHKDAGADLTVSVLEVPMEEASRFGIMSVDENDRITKFAEKPANPDSNLASMGIYIFNWPVLKDALKGERGIENSDMDFGKNIIPRLLGEGKKLNAYRFSGYWKDVGTIESYYNAQMEMMEDTSAFNIFDRELKVFSNSNLYPPHYIGPDGQVSRSMVCNGCYVNGTVSHSILGLGASVGKNAEIKDSIILPEAKIGAGAKLNKVIVNENVSIPAGVSVGDGKDILLIGEGYSFEG